MGENLFIRNSLIIRDSAIRRNGKIIFKDNRNLTMPDFLKALYKLQKLKYPKFFKMDMLSKLGFLGVEILVAGEIQDKNTALIFANAASSLETDKAYAETVQEFPSPSLFVYTLPNIVMGEISIRHELRSENTFFVTEEFEPGLYVDYARMLFAQEKTDTAVCGWLNLHNNDYDVFLWQIARSGETYFNEEELKKLYLPTHE